MPAPDQALVDALGRLSFRVIAVLTRLGATYDLSLTQVRVLGILRDQEPRMSELAAHLGLDRSTVSGLVDRAGDRGLVERFPDEDDRRVSRVRLTAAGRRLASTLEADASADLEAIVSALGVGDRRTLHALIESALAR